MKEEDIRPSHLFEEYLRLAQEDAIKYFSDTPRLEITCPACGGQGKKAFVKAGFTYQECPSCRTIYVSPRPPAEAFQKYYTESESSKFWATTFYKQTAEARREKLWKPKAQMINTVIQRYGHQGSTVIDIGGGYGLFAEEMSDLLGEAVTVIEPAPHLADVCRSKDLPVVESFLESADPSDLPSGSKVFVSFELFEHLHDPGLFLDQLNRLMNSGDLFIFTSPSGAGADVRALWEDSKTISPPHHLNFFNPSSITFLFESHALEVLETSTPGKLDVDILINDQDKIKDRFWQVFIQQASQEEKAAMQDFLANTGFSSHMMVVSRKP